MQNKKKKNVKIWRNSFGFIYQMGNFVSAKLKK